MGGNGWQSLEMAGNGTTWLEMAEQILYLKMFKDLEYQIFMFFFKQHDIFDVIVRLVIREIWQRVGISMGTICLQQSYII